MPTENDNALKNALQQIIETALLAEEHVAILIAERDAALERVAELERCLKTARDRLALFWVPETPGAVMRKPEYIAEINAVLEPQLKNEKEE